MEIVKTRTDRVSVRLIRGIIAALIASIAYGVIFGESLTINNNSGQITSSSTQQGDVALYSAILTRMSLGDSYYATTADELKRGGYPLRSVWNFRLPTLAVILSWLPDEHARHLALQSTILLVCTAWTVKLLRVGASPLVAAVGFTCVGSSLLAPFAAPASGLFHEVWASLAIALALALHGRRTWPLSVVLGLAAVCVRELSLAFLFVMLAVAYWEDQLIEALFWLGTIVLFGVFLFVHTAFAGPQLTGELAHSWVCWGGWSFVLSTAKWNIVLHAAPHWVSALLVPVALLGLMSWDNPIGTRAFLTVATYMCAFLVIGRPDNSYWGLMYAPLLPLGWLLAVATTMQIRSAAVSLGRVGV